MNAVIASRSANAGGENVGGGLTFRLRGRTKFYTEVRYHHAGYNIGKVDVLPLTFGLRW